MPQRKKKTYIWVMLPVLAGILIVVLLSLNFDSEANPNVQKPDQTKEISINTSSNKPVKPERSLAEIVRTARTWRPYFESWYGKTAPDFAVTDIGGKLHKLSDYRGKKVMIVFWATWCGPCIREIPHLIELRNTFSEDEFAMLAISYAAPNNTAQMVKNFVQNNKQINYSTFSVPVNDLPMPFNSVQYIPCSFFIEPDGTLKLATSGLISLQTMKNILLAK